MIVLVSPRRTRETYVFIIGEKDREPTYATHAVQLFSLCFAIGRRATATLARNSILYTVLNASLWFLMSN